MSTKLPISVFIITKNEADRVANTIKSVRDWVDEIVVVDSGSEDNTVQVAKDAGADMVEFNEWNGYGEQKNFAQSLCKNEWVLNLDADEEISLALRDEILYLFTTTPSPQTAYRLRCVLMFPHQNKPSWGAYVNAPVRLYNIKTSKFKTSTVHDSVVVQDGVEVIKLKGDVHHKSFRSEAHMVAKLNEYSTMQAADMFAKGKKVGIIRTFFEPYVMFFKHYVLRKHFVYGFSGFSTSRNYAYYRFLRLAKLRELWALEKKS